MSREKSFDDLAHKAHHDFEDAKQGLLNGAKVQYDENGASIYGFRVHKAFGPLIDFVSSVFAPKAIKFATDYVERGASAAVEAIVKLKAPNKAKAAGEMAGQVAKYGVFFGMVFSKLIGKGYRIAKDRWDEGSELYNQFRPIAQATGVSAKTNGVMKLEYNHINSQALSKVGRLWVEFPEAIATAIVSYEEMKETDLWHKAEQQVPSTGKTPKELSGAIEEHFNTLNNQRIGARNSFSKLIFEQKEMSMGVVGAAKQGLQFWADDKEKQVTADNRHVRPLELIQRLAHDVNELRGPSHDGACGLKEIESRDISDIKNKVIKIFQRYEIDMEAMRRKAGKSYLHHGEITGTGNVDALNKVAQLITDAIANDTIDVRTLVSLVGDEKVISHTTEKRTISVDAAIAQIAELHDKLGTSAAPDPKEFFAHFDSPEAMKDALKAHLKEMQGVERSSFASLFADNVLKAAGMKPEEITAARKEAHDHMYKLVAANVKELAGKHREELEKLQIKEEDIDTLIDLSDRLDRGDKKALKSLVDGRGRVLLQNILGVAALQELQADKTAWTNRVKKSWNPEQYARGNGEGAREDDHLHHKPESSAIRREEMRRAKHSPDAGAHVHAPG